MTPNDFIDLLSMMVFSMLAALVLIELLEMRRIPRGNRRSPRVRLWLVRLGIAGLSLMAALVAPAFAPALLGAGMVFILFGVREVPATGGGGGSIFLLLGRAQ